MDKLIEYKRINPATNTVTRDVTSLSPATSNIYEAVVVVAKRADEITKEVTQELNDKLAEFAYYNDSPEKEVFENEEQIELSRQYERMPKPVLIAMEEFLEQRFDFERPQEEPKKGDDEEEAVYPIA